MMKRISAMIIGFGLIVSAALPVSAAIGVYEFKSTEQEQAFQKLTATLRCPKCQNNTIADSNATLAQDMRQKVYEMLDEGKSEQAIIDYMVARYGNFVTYDPPLMASTVILWLGPILFIFIGFSILVMRSRKVADVKKKVELGAAEEQRLKTLLEEIEQSPKTNGKVK